VSDLLQLQDVAPPAVPMRPCTKCNTLRPLSEFGRDGRRLRAECNPCRRAIRKRQYAASDSDTRAKTRERHIGRKYGLTTEQYDQLFYAQCGRCAICRHPFRGPKDTHVDHHHTSMMVRALLCSPCNTGIGMSREDVDRLAAMAAYLQAHR
jgi:hypothetical protein